MNTGFKKQVVILWLLCLSCQMTDGAILHADSMENQPIEKTFRLRLGEEKVLTAENLTLKFTALLEDSRCPVGVFCVWEGNAAISIQVSDSGKNIQEVILNTHGGQDMPDNAQTFGHVVKLHQLSPYPRQDTVAGSRDYEATLTITPSK